MAIVKNMLVRIGLDASSLTGGMKKAKEKVTSDLSEVGKSAEKLNGLGTALSGAFDGAAKDLENAQAQMKQLTAYSTALETNMEGVFRSGGGDAANVFAALNAENDKVIKKIETLQGRIEVLKVQAQLAAEQAAQSAAQTTDALGETEKATEAATNPEKVNIFRRAWEQQFGAVENIVPSLKNVGKALASISWAGIKRIPALTGLKEDLQGVGARLKTVGSHLKEIAKHPIKSAFSGVKSVASSLLGVGKHLLGIGKNAAASDNGIGKIVSSLKKFGGLAIGLKLVSSIFGRLRSIVSSYISENSALQAQVNQLKASLGQALAPAINLVTNAFALLMPYVVGVSNAIGELITNLFGSGWTTVADGANAAASATSGAADAQKEYNQQLMGFDQITKVSDKNSSGGGGGSSSTTTPVEGKLPSWLTDLGTKVKAAISAGDWGGAATAITDKLNGLIAGIDWGEWGTKLGGYLNSALTFLSTAITTFDWHSLGSDLAESVNGILDSVDWSNLGVILGAKFQIAVDTLGGFFEKLDWTAAGNSLADSFSGLWNSIDWAQVGTTFSDGATGIFTSIKTTIQNIDWYQMGRDISSALANIDWNGIMDNLAEAIGSAIGGAVSLVAGLFQDAWDNLKSWWYDNAFENGNFTMEGLLNGIWEGVKNIGKWIKEHIFDPFIEGFKKTFKIHSPAQAPELVAASKNVGLGILEALATPFKKIKDWVKDHILDPLKKALGIDDDSPIAEFVLGVKNTASEWWDNVKSWWSEKTKDGKEAVGEFTAKVKNTASTWWSNTKSWWRSMTNNGTATVGEFTANVRNSAATWWSNVKAWWASKTSSGAAAVGEFTANLRNTASTWWSNAKSWWSTQSQNGLIVSAGVKLFKDGWQSLSDFIGSVTKTIKIGISWKTEGLNALEAGISKYLFGGKGFPLGLRFAAKGGIVNTAALFGNTVVGEAGREAIVPLERNTEWANIVAGKIADVLRNAPNGGGNNRPVNINLLLDGQVVGRASVNWINGQIASTGVIPLNL